MSQKLMLVKYELENGIPIDESSENLRSTYAPAELIDWVAESKLFHEVKIKESSGDDADVPIYTLNDCEGRHLESILHYIENRLVRCIEDAYSDISKGVLIPKELDNHFSSLHIWLEIRKVLKEKEEKYHSNSSIKLVIG